MSLRNAKPLTLSPHTANDTIDASTSRPGAMAALTNLIPDPTTRDLWQCRPAAQLLVDLATHGFNTPTFISVTYLVGTRLYGMVATSRNPGQDEPFCYDIAAQAVVTITGVTAANSPISPAQTGAWNPPIFTLVGTKLILAHPGFTGAGNAYFGVLDTTNPGALTWTATNVTTPGPNTATPLPVPPQWVANFNGRCYFLVNPPNGQPAAFFSDVLNPTVMSNAPNIQIITFGDNIPLTSAYGLALFNQLGGIIQSLIVFKGVTNIFQVTGDPTTQNLAVNSLNVATGTLSPNSVTTTTKGLAFLAPDGLRIIDFTARVSDPIGRDGEGITTPFYFSLNPSRANASFNSGVYRCQIQNGLATGSPQQEWWYDFVRDCWSGPHTTNISMIEPYSNSFVVTLQGAGGKIFQSDVVQGTTSTFVENGVQLTYNFQTSLLPDTEEMSENCIVEATQHAALSAGLNIVCVALDQNGVVLDTVTIVATGSQTLWGQFTWGQALWQGAANALAPRQLKWNQPLVFQRLSLSFLGTSATGIKLGRLRLRYQILGYLLADSFPVKTLATTLSIGRFTLNANATTTTVVTTCTTTASVLYAPITPNAGNDMATTSVVPGNGQFVLTHANNSRTDRTFDYAVIG
jgi:hypothetical protein